MTRTARAVTWRNVRSLTFGLLAIAALVGVAKHLRGSVRGNSAPGGILIADTNLYDTMSRVLLGSFYKAIADDVATAAPPGSRILEVGCGPGHLSIELARRGLEVTGVDLDQNMIEHTRANVARHHDYPGGPPSFQSGDASSLPSPDESFDVVVSTLSVHHWSDPTAGFSEIARVLRPGGRALIWDLRPGRVPFHGNTPDLLELAEASPLGVISARPWRWPWKFAPTQRIELELEA